MKLPQPRQITERLHQWLDRTPIHQRLRYLVLLNVAGLLLLLLLNVASGVLRDRYFNAIERLNAEQRELRHFVTETARLQASIREYLSAPNDDLTGSIDQATALLFLDLSKMEEAGSDYAESLGVLRTSLQTFVGGYRELKQINKEIDFIYQTELLEPSKRSAELLALIIGSNMQNPRKSLLDPASLSLINAFVDSLLKMNAYYANRETNVSLSTRASLERVAALAPVLRELAPGELERKSLSLLESRVYSMISGLGSLQRASSNRAQIMERKIEASQRAITQAASALDKRYARIEEELRQQHGRQLHILNASIYLVGALVVALAFLFGALIARSIRHPLDSLMGTVGAFSAGNFEHPIPEVGSNEFGQFAGALRDLRHSAIERNRAEFALRANEARFRALSDMSSDLFWRQDSESRFVSFSGTRATELMEAGLLRVGERPWDNPRMCPETGDWEAHRATLDAQRPFRNLEVALQTDGTALVHLLINGDPLFDQEGGFLGYHGTAKDITTQKAAESEIRQLNASLEQRVKQRTAELQATNEQLSQAMEQLVQNEKLVSLGNLVAGVAHELNTPLGNALVATTSLRDHVNQVQQAVADGQLRKSLFDTFLGQCAEGCQIIERNTQRAATLVASFKQVAVDQTSAQRRRFGLRKTIGEVVAALAPTLRKQQLSITLDIPEDLEMDSYPGPLDQVITNIVSNAALHAYEEAERGDLLISAARLHEHEIMLMLSDNGRGIPLERQGRVFDPFFTTRLGQGGTGLGLYIVYNIVTNLLGGHIQLVSAEGAGTCFILRLPCVAPGHELGGLAAPMSVEQTSPSRQ